MPIQGDLESLINAELRELRVRLTDTSDPVETAVFTICLGEFCHELLTRLTASGNTTIEHGKTFFSKLANTVGAHPRVPANDVGPALARRFLEAHRSRKTS